MLRKPPRCLLAEDQLLVRRHLEDSPFPFDELRTNVKLFLDGVGQTGRAGLVVSLNAVLDGKLELRVGHRVFPCW